MERQGGGRTPWLAAGLIAVVIVVAVFLVFRDNLRPQAPAQGPGSGGGAGAGALTTPVSVQVEPARRADVEEIASWSGTLQPRYQVDVLPNRAGKLQEVAVRQGQRVQQGQRIATVEHDDLLLQERQAAASVASSRANLRRAEAQLEQKQRDLQRVEQLYERGAATQQEVTVARQAVEDAMIQRDVALAQLEQAEATYESIQLQLEKVHLVAPVSGVVMQDPPVPGTQVNASTPVVTLAALDPIEVHFHVPEREIGRLYVGQPFTLTLDAFPGETFHGEIVSLGTSIDQQTRTLLVRGQVANHDLRLRPGMFARVELLMARAEQVLAVPREALLARSSGYYVYVVEDGRARSRPIELGIQGIQRVQVLSGLAEGDVVITVGQQRLREGQPVRVVQVDAVTGAGAGAPAGDRGIGPDEGPAARGQEGR